MSKQSTESDVYKNPDLVICWGEGCSYPKIVTNWLLDNNQSQKLKINYKEIYRNRYNLNDLLGIVNKYCPELKDESGINISDAFNLVNKKCYQESHISSNIFQTC